jgi:hypothetical protein
MGVDGLTKAIRGCGRGRGLRGSIFGLGLAAPLFGWGAPLLGQEVQFRQQTQLYLPTRFSIQNGVIDLQQKVGVRLGARLNLNFNPRLSLATGVSYIPGYANLRATGKRVAFLTGAHLLTAGTRLVYWVVPAGKAVSWEIHSGVGVASGGARYQDLAERATLSAMVGTAVYWEIGQLIRLSLRVQERLYRLQLGNGEGGSAGKPLRVALGIGFPFLQSSLQRLRVLP